MREWVVDHVVLLSVISGVAVFAGIVAAVMVAVLLPEDYFTKPPEHRHGKGLARMVAKNGVGVVLLLAGFVMALPLVPGPGVIVMLVGLSMTDFPGKRKLEVQLLRIPGLLGQLNRVRGWFGRGELRLAGGSGNSPSPQPARGGKGA